MDGFWIMLGLIVLAVCLHDGLVGISNSWIKFISSRKDQP